jgi:hypothetical protein
MITFITQFKYDSQDRLKNLLRSVIYLHHNFKNNCEIIIIDQDNNNEYLYELFNSYQVSDLLIKSFNIEGPYHRSKIINEGLKISKNNACLIFDCDILLPKEQIDTAYLLLNNGYDVVYPYSTPQYDVPQEYFESFQTNYNFSEIQKNITARQYGILNEPYMIKYGNTAFGMMVDKSSLGNLVYFNEEFNGWGYEDNEYLFRLDKFGAKITRVWGPVFHVEHSRDLQHQYNHYTNNNCSTYEHIKNMSTEELITYYKKLNLIN